ncbi:MAG: histidine ammonia-lyase [Bacteroidales bacterium]|jgi:histidine ammonia-lyase|nr:histidine ammonia-lyase [Bacteroidales bacterium]MCI2145604.1 histidine ammonia-lyase [Bacteroidales bacterium]
MHIFTIDGNKHTIENAKLLLYDDCLLVLGDNAKKRIRDCRNFLDSKVASSNDPIYGVTTGFGSLCDVSVGEKDLGCLQTNLVKSHACSIGDPVEISIIKLMMALKVKSLAYGYSGIRLETAQRLVDMFNNHVYPVVYQQGSLGASGDLAPLANMCLPLIGLGEVYYKGEKRPSAGVLSELGWKPLTLASKEGLALLNGTQFMLAHCVLAFINAMRISALADKIGALSLDAYDGRIEPFNEYVHLVRPHPGQIATAKAVREYLAGSEMISRHKVHVQDPYSFRCIPQVHGAVKDALDYVGSVFEIELNSATDNPTILPGKDLIISAGNFHGEPLAIALDYLSIAMAELGSISERRTYRLIEGKRGLPSFLVAHPGLNSGFMIPQYAAASIASQNKQLCTPACVDTVDSSQGQEDHVSMGGNAATKCLKVVYNVEEILAIELFNAAQAFEFRHPTRTSPILEQFIADYRKFVPFVEEDEVMYPLINKSIQFLKKQNI